MKLSFKIICCFAFTALFTCGGSFAKQIKLESDQLKAQQLLDAGKNLAAAELLEKYVLRFPDNFDAHLSLAAVTSN